MHGHGPCHSEAHDVFTFALVFEDAMNIRVSFRQIAYDNHLSGLTVGKPEHDVQLACQCR